MKSKVIIASAALTTLCCIYLVRLNEKSEAYSQEQSAGTLIETNDSPSVYELSTVITPNDRKDLERKIRTKRTTITIDPSIDNTIYGNEGTRLDFPANSFVDASGNIITQKVRIRIDECYKVSDMITSKLSTTSDGRMLETAGMVDISAFSRSREVSLRKDGAYDISFPKNGNEKDDFKLFYGEWNEKGIINWNLAEDFDDVSEEENLSEESNFVSEEYFSEYDQEDMADVQPRQSLLEDDEYCFVQISESNLRRGTQISEMDYFNWQLTSGQTLNQWFVSNFNPDIQMLEEYCIMGLRTEITFKVDEQGRFKSYYISQSAKPDYDRAIVGFLETMPPLDLQQLMPAYTDDHACILSFASRHGKQADTFAQQFKAQHKAELDKPLKNVEASTLDYFVFSSSELGWINCDRFYDNEGPTVDYVVENRSNAPVTVHMVFEDISSVLQGVNEGNEIKFTGIPANRKVRIVGLETGSEGPLMCVARGNTSDTKQTLTTYKPFSIRELEAQFARSN